MSEQFQMTRRSMLAGAAIAGALTPLVGAASAQAEEAVAKIAPVDIASLPRVKVDLVKPPFVHAHTQKAEGGPKVVEFTLTIEEKKIIVDDQ
ncbi:MAG: nitrite reductase, copper-containing, partial [Sinorhizobium fredii]|nr:nitrite reductase, copper-containing [Sinorhizobium fredii]